MEPNKRQSNLGIQAGANLETKKSYGYPYGSIPRLLLAWVTTEATRTKSHRLELGANLNSFMSALGLSANTGRGKRGDAKRLRDQMDRLFNANISFQYATKGERRSGAARLNMQIARKSVFWWSEKNPQQSVLWDSWIELTEEFYKAVTAEPLPLDVRILKHIKQSPLAIDLYTILNREAYRASKGGKPRFLAWKWLQAQIGNEYGDSRNFRAKALIQIQHILDVNPHLLLKQEKGRSGQKSGLTISNLSLPSIRPKD